MESVCTIISETELLDRKRNRSLIGFTVAFLIWIVSAIPVIVVTYLLGYIPSPVIVTSYSIIFGIGGLACWIFFLSRYLLIQRRIKRDPSLAEALNDEVVRYAWTRAAAFGFWAMLTFEACHLFGRVISTLLIHFTGDIPYTYLAFSDFHSPLAVAVGVGTMIIAYLYFRRD